MEIVKYNGKGIIWNSFLRTKDLTKAKCTGCGQEFQSRSKATSTLRRHLETAFAKLRSKEKNEEITFDKHETIGKIIAHLVAVDGYSPFYSILRFQFSFLFSSNHTPPSIL